RRAPPCRLRVGPRWDASVKGTWTGLNNASRATPARPRPGAARSAPRLSRVATELKPVYLITGGDRPKIQRALRRLRERIGEDAVEMLSAEDASGEDAVAACNSMGLLGGGRRFVIIEGVERWKVAEVKTVSSYLAAY